MREIKRLIASILKFVLFIFSKFKIKKNLCVSDNFYYDLKKRCDINRDEIFGNSDFKNDECVVYKRQRDDKTLLAIIIPIYNTEKYLDACLNSVAKQITKYSYEVILIDNASEDNSFSIMKKYYDSFPHLFSIIRVKNNNGPGAGKNIGLNFCNTKYISFLDSDDLLNLNFVEKTISKSEEMDSDIIKAGYIQFSENESEKYKISFEDKTITIEEDCFPNIVAKTDSFVWGSIMKRSLFDNVRFPVGYKKIIDDRIMKLLIFTNITSLTFLNFTGYLYRLNENGTTLSNANFGKFPLQSVFFYDAIKKYFEINGLQNLLFQKILMHELCYFLFFTSMKLETKLKKEIFCFIVYIFNEFGSYYEDFSKTEKMQYNSLKNNNYYQRKICYYYKRIEMFLEKK